MDRNRRSRRAVLAALGTGAAAGLGGCLGPGGHGGEHTHLDATERQADPDVLPFPTHGDELPAATVPAPLRGTAVAIPEDLAGRDALLTFVYTHCMTMCPRLTAILASVQDHAIDQGYAGDVAFVETTFDPARDDAGRFRQWAETHGVSLSGDGWYFLRPESERRAREVVQERYGVAFQKTTPDDVDGYMFAHTGLVVLANRDGYVERTYRLRSGGGAVAWQDVRDDLTTLRRREG